MHRIGTAVAHFTCICFSIKKNNFLQIMDEYPKVKRDVIKLFFYIFNLN